MGFELDSIDDGKLQFMIENSYNMYKPKIKEFIESIWNGSIPTCGRDVADIINKLD